MYTGLMTFEVGEILECRIDRRMPGFPHARAQVKYVGYSSLHLSEVICGLEFFPEWRHFGKSDGKYRGQNYFRPRTKGAAIFLTPENVEANFRKLTVDIGDVLTFRNGENGVVRYIGDVGEKYPRYGLELQLSLARLIGETNGSFRGRQLFQTLHPGTAIFLEGHEVARYCKVTKKVKRLDSPPGEKLKDRVEASLYFDNIQMRQERHTRNREYEHLTSPDSPRRVDDRDGAMRRQSHPQPRQSDRPNMTQRMLSLFSSTKKEQVDVPPPALNELKTLMARSNPLLSNQHVNLERINRAAAEAPTDQAADDIQDPIDFGHDFLYYGLSGNIEYWRCERCGGMQGIDERTGNLHGPSADKLCRGGF